MPEIKASIEVHKTAPAAMSLITLISGSKIWVYFIREFF